MFKAIILIGLVMISPVDDVEYTKKPKINVDSTYTYQLYNDGSCFDVKENRRVIIRCI